MGNFLVIPRGTPKHWGGRSGPSPRVVFTFPYRSLPIAIGQGATSIYPKQNQTVRGHPLSQCIQVGDGWTSGSKPLQPLCALAGAAITSPGVFALFVLLLCFLSVCLSFLSFLAFFLSSFLLRCLTSSLPCCFFSFVPPVFPSFLLCVPLFFPLLFVLLHLVFLVLIFLLSSSSFSVPCLSGRGGSEIRSWNPPRAGFEACGPEKGMGAPWVNRPGR